MLVGSAVFATRHGIVGLYTQDAAVIAAAVPLLTWVALFHVGDALQTMSQFVLRAWRVTVVSLVVFALSMWGVGLAGGYALAFGLLGGAQGAGGFWLASTVGLVLAGVALTVFLAWMLRRQRRASVTPAA